MRNLLTKSLNYLVIMLPFILMAFSLGANLSLGQVNDKEISSLIEFGKPIEIINSTEVPPAKNLTLLNSTRLEAKYVVLYRTANGENPVLTARSKYFYAPGLYCRTTDRDGLTLVPEPIATY